MRACGSVPGLRCGLGARHGRRAQMASSLCAATLRNGEGALGTAWGSRWGRLRERWSPRAVCRAQQRGSRVLLESKFDSRPVRLSGMRLSFFDMPMDGILSSRWLHNANLFRVLSPFRKCVENEQSILYMTPTPVVKYIREHRLFREVGDSEQWARPPGERPLPDSHGKYDAE